MMNPLLADSTLMQKERQKIRMNPFEMAASGGEARAQARRLIGSRLSTADCGRRKKRVSA